MKLTPFLDLLVNILGIYYWLAIAMVVISIVVHLDIINRHNHTIEKIINFLEAFLEPLLRRIRKYVPLIAGFDISPVILWLAVNFFRNLIEANMNLGF
jgi:YggT family protein